MFKRITHKLIVDGIRYSNIRRTFMQTYLISESGAQIEQMNGCSVVCNFSCARFLYEPESCNQTHTRAHCTVFIYYGYTVAHTNMDKFDGLHFVAAAVHFDAAICTRLVSVRKSIFSLEMRYTGIDV